MFNDDGSFIFNFNPFTAEAHIWACSSDEYIDILAFQRVQEEKKTVPSANTTPLLSNDVASILQRRKYLIGDMCDDSNSSEEESDNVWSDEEDDSWN